MSVVSCSRGDSLERLRRAMGFLRFCVCRAAVPCMFAIVAVASRAQARFITDYQLDRDIVEVPFEYKGHQILVKGQTGGRKDLTFLFDSGASSPVLDTSLGLRGTHLADTHIQEADGVTNAESIWLDDLRLGPENSAANVTNISVLLTDLSQISRVLGRHIDGILGMSFIAGFVVDIDYEKHLLRFRRERDFTLDKVVPDNQRVFLFDVRRSNPHSKISTVLLSGLLHPKYDYDFLLDTGFGGYASIAHLAAEEAGMIHSDTPRVAGTSYGVTHSFESDKIRAPFLMIGGINLSGKIVSIDYRNKDVIGQTGILGNKLLQNYHVTLDYARHKLLLERNASAEEEDEAARPSFGIIIQSNSKTILVNQVKRYSPAQRSGVRTGDAILMIDGRPVENMSTADVANMLTSAQGEMRFQLRRGIDPNLGTGGNEYTLSMTPISPFEWKQD